MATMQINGMTLYYEQYGHGYPLILIAGYCCDHSYWTLMLNKLMSDYQVIIFDNRGSGQTQDAGEAFTLETMASDVMTLIQQLGIHRPHLVGHSMGGAIAQIIARNFSEKINKMVVLNSSAKFNVRTNQAMGSLLQLRKANAPVELLIEAVMPWLFSCSFLAVPENVAMFKNALMNYPYPQSVEDQERQFKALLSFDSNSWLHEIKTATLVMTCEEDIIALPSESRQLKNGIDQAELTILEGGHSSPIEQADNLCQMIQKFLR